MPSASSGDVTSRSHSEQRNSPTTSSPTSNNSVPSSVMRGTQGPFGVGSGGQRGDQAGRRNEGKHDEAGGQEARLGDHGPTDIAHLCRAPVRDATEGALVDGTLAVGAEVG